MKYNGITPLENGTANASVFASIGGFFGSRWGSKPALAGTALGIIFGGWLGAWRAKQGVDQHNLLVEKNDSLMQELNTVRKQLDTIKAVTADSSQSHTEKESSRRMDASQELSR